MGHSVILPFRLKVLSGYLIPILKINNATLILRCWRQKHIYIYRWSFFFTVLHNIPKSIGLSLSDEGSIFFLIVFPNCERNNRKNCPYYKKNILIYQHQDNFITPLCKLSNQIIRCKNKALDLMLYMTQSTLKDFIYIQHALRYTFSSNHNVYKSSCGLCFLAPDPLIDIF